MNARRFFNVVKLILLIVLFRPETCQPQSSKHRPPNIVIILCDDLGYGDLGVYGHPSIRTPQIDRMVSEGVRFTDFYSAAPVCTPSRAALLTGRLPIRSGMCGDDKHRVLRSNAAGGLPAEEITLAEALKPRGFATACIGKWHLGQLPQYLPTRNGFDEYFGLPYSNDMDRVADRSLGRAIFWNPKSEFWNPPLMRGEETIEQPAQQQSITRRYTDEATRFVRRNRNKPFFLYLAHSFPHVPLFLSDQFLGKSRRGRYGDVVEELDWSVGQILETVKTENLAEDTFVFFTSDNGPWLIFDDHGGSAGLLREGKGSTWEGGMRVPGIAWWPGKIPSGQVVHSVASTMDLFTTCLRLAGADVPSDRVIDGQDISKVLFGGQAEMEQPFFYYRGPELYAMRLGQFKAHYVTRSAYGDDAAVAHKPPLLYHLGHDPSETFDIARDHPEILMAMDQAREGHRKQMVPAKPQLEALLPER
jgi:arylsulfatase A